MILNEMARIGYIDDLELIIWTDDPGNIPHFHIRDKETKGNNFHCCIRLDEPSYFKHQGKMDVLNAKQNEIYFTSGGSESDNIAIKGIAYANKEKR